jgi:magnesium-transporting ATPase (P-type)
MFSNIGRKIKILGMVIFWLGMAFAAIVAVYGMYNGGADVGLLTVLPAMIPIVLAVLVMSYMVAGIGELIEHVQSIHQKMRDGAQE